MGLVEIVADSAGQAPMVEACCSMLQHLFLGPVGRGFEACRSMRQHTEICSVLPLQTMLYGVVSDMHLHDVLRLSVCWLVCLWYLFIAIGVPP